jgi:hypothetical protein
MMVEDEEHFLLAWLRKVTLSTIIFLFTLHQESFPKLEVQGTSYIITKCYILTNHSTLNTPLAVPQITIHILNISKTLQTTDHNYFSVKIILFLYQIIILQFNLF